MIGIGELAALGSAFLWTISSMLMAGVPLSAWKINICKCVLGAIIVGIHLLIAKLVFSQDIAIPPIHTWGMLGLSSITGLLIGDTFYYRSLQILGARRSLMVLTTSPVFSMLLAWLVLGETLTPMAIVGIVFTLAGVVVVVIDRTSTMETTEFAPGKLIDGVFFGLAGALCQSLGSLCSKMAIVRADGTEICGAEEATWIRLSISAVAFLIVGLFQGELVPLYHSAANRRVLPRLMAATMLGTWLGIIGSMIALSGSDVAIAQTLMTTCPLFAVPIAYFYFRQHISMISILGTITGIAGVYFIVGSGK